jgi:hypothetical protein
MSFTWGRLGLGLATPVAIDDPPQDQADAEPRNQTEPPIARHRAQPAEPTSNSPTRGGP